jgi:hypothetical protein
MPVSYAKMAANEASVTITGGPLGNDSLTVVYYPNKLTPQVLIELDQVFDKMCQRFSEVVKSWDMLADDGSMYPLDPASLEALGVPVLQLIIKRIVQDTRPN